MFKHALLFAVAVFVFSATAATMIWGDRLFQIVSVSDFDTCILVGGVVTDTVPRRCVYSSAIYIERFSTVVEQYRLEQAKPSLDKTTVTEVVMSIGPEPVDCVGVGRTQCLVVNGELFYDDIEGFEHQYGRYYKIIAERTLRFGTDDPERIPQDASIYRYELQKILSITETDLSRANKPSSQTPDPSTVETLDVLSATSTDVSTSTDAASTTSTTTSL